MTTIQTDLSQSALDGMGLVCSDLEMLHRETAKTNPLGAKPILEALSKAARLEQELQNIWILIK